MYLHLSRGIRGIREYHPAIVVFVVGLKVWLANFCETNCCRRCRLWQPCVNQKTLCHGVVASPDSGGCCWSADAKLRNIKKLYPPNLMCVPVCICGLGCLSLVTVENQIITMIRFHIFHYPQDPTPLSVFFFPWHCGASNPIDTPEDEHANWEYSPFQRTII